MIYFETFVKPAPAYKPASYHPEPKYNEEAKPFAYDYAVNDHYSGANFAKKEESDGHNTQGYYSVALPDGRVQHVKYVADKYGGYNAEVTYEGEAQYPEYQPAPAYKHVKYVADKYGGFNAEVTYEGEAQYPEHHPAPAYKAAAPAYKSSTSAYKSSHKTAAPEL
ncbi:cuticle protein 7-like [Pollicipes pollicipes]|uniref:cuticle protein 7-like n=1 Tax=Pollicipes pollicipes TaxID=41117 RepID=UPI0018857A5A|nr:cuticle protein 7-like [Pollicipes pollicipes]